MKFETRAIHSGNKSDSATGAITTPIYQTSTFQQEAVGKHKGFVYTRTDNPTRHALEDNLAALENAKYGLCFASGLAAVNTVMNLLKSGDHVVSANDIYGGTYRIFTKLFTKYGMTFDLVDATNLDNVRRVIRPNTKVLWLETPSNPLLKITDLKAAIALAHKHRILTVVDNTFATPYLQQPFDFGADIVLHSTTKYLGGHSDILGGALITNNKDLYERLKFFQNAVGAVPGPFDCFLTLRGTKTLALRMERHCSNAMAIARFLSRHPKVKKVFYPGLPNHPGHKIAKKQMTLSAPSGARQAGGFGGMVSFEVKGKTNRFAALTARKIAASAKLFALAESLGCVRSLINHPPSMTHASVEPEVRKKIGINDNLIRLSVGIENVQDLIEDLKRALRK
ncbi:MAG: cystathionine gamma-synthase [Planctomycetes bacterium]|nr:cystathionine gamma-synthase [Planctomycetota bacterium]